MIRLLFIQVTILGIKAWYHNPAKKIPHVLSLYKTRLYYLRVYKSRWFLQQMINNKVRTRRMQLFNKLQKKIKKKLLNYLQPLSNIRKLKNQNYNSIKRQEMIHSRKLKLNLRILGIVYKRINLILKILFKK